MENAGLHTPFEAKSSAIEGNKEVGALSALTLVSGFPSMSKSSICWDPLDTRREVSPLYTVLQCWAFRSRRSTLTLVSNPRQVEERKERSFIYLFVFPSRLCQSMGESVTVLNLGEGMRDITARVRGSNGSVEGEHQTQSVEWLHETYELVSRT